MPLKYTVTLTSLGTSYVIAMPKPIVEGFGLVKGQKIDLYVNDNGIQIPLHQKSPSEIEEEAEKVASKYRSKVKNEK